MKLTENDILKLAQLANLSVHPGEMTAFNSKLEEVLRYVEKLAEVDTEGVEPTAHVTGQTNILADDVVEPSLPTKAWLPLAPQSTSSSIKVKEVFEGSGS